LRRPRKLKTSKGDLGSPSVRGTDSRSRHIAFRVDAQNRKKEMSSKRSEKESYISTGEQGRKGDAEWASDSIVYKADVNRGDLTTLKFNVVLL